MSKTERQTSVDELAARLKELPNVYVTDFSGLNVLRMNAIDGDVDEREEGDGASERGRKRSEHAAA